jgi:butyryl-CoA dehydrogenase
MGNEADTTRAAADFEKAARTTADDAARVILRGMLKNAPRILIGADAVAIDAMARLAPRSYDTIVGRAVKAAAKRRAV